MVNRCFLCKEEEESTDHILLHYAKVSVPWKLLFSLFGIQWVQAATVKEAFLEWHGPFVSKIPMSKKNKKERYQEELEERIISLIASLFGGILRGSRRDRLLSKFVENECEKIDRLMELYIRYLDRVKAETKRMNQLKLDDLEMDEDERYNRRLEAGLYTLQVSGFLWTCSYEH
ncbi:Beta-catenin-like protein 1 [Vitis vinifera]|uniref:Beta-catenin-like protein 1 n=1 Tax=Vitis vinifera TaxID=29760 RepID=A0A438C6G9_VITVI|nr:Beta-catenin-like protein 1 [Vitis vinifera]